MPKSVQIDKEKFKALLYSIGEIGNLDRKSECFTGENCRLNHSIMEDRKYVTDFLGGANHLNTSINQLIRGQSQELRELRALGHFAK